MDLVEGIKKVAAKLGPTLKILLGSSEKISQDPVFV